MGQVQSEVKYTTNFNTTDRMRIAKEKTMANEGGLDATWQFPVLK